MMITEKTTIDIKDIEHVVLNGILVIHYQARQAAKIFAEHSDEGKELSKYLKRISMRCREMEDNIRMYHETRRIFSS